MKLPESFDRAMRDLRRAQIPVYAGNAAFFLVLSFLPLLTLLLAALQYTVFRPEDLLALLSRIMPDEVLPLFSDFLQKAYQKSGAAIISLSALTAAWSASRGICAGNKKLSAPAAFVPVLHAAICTGTGSDASFSCVRAQASRASDPEGITAGGHAFVSAGASAALLVSASYGAVLPFVSRPPGPQAAPECGLSRCAGGSGRLAAVFRALFRVRQPFREGTGALRKPDDDGSDHALGLRLREHRLLRRVFEPPAPAPSDGRIARVFSAAP